MKNVTKPRKLLKENFFVSYAVKGNMVNSFSGVRADMPSNLPMCNSPVKEPSPLNTRWKYDPDYDYRWPNPEKYFEDHYGIL